MSEMPKMSFNPPFRPSDCEEAARLKRERSLSFKPSLGSIQEEYIPREHDFIGKLSSLSSSNEAIEIKEETWKGQEVHNNEESMAETDHMEGKPCGFRAEALDEVHEKRVVAEDETRKKTNDEMNKHPAVKLQDNVVKEPGEEVWNDEEDKETDQKIPDKVGEEPPEKIPHKVTKELENKVKNGELGEMTGKETQDEVSEDTAVEIVDKIAPVPGEKIQSENANEPGNKVPNEDGKETGMNIPDKDAIEPGKKRPDKVTKEPGEEIPEKAAEKPAEETLSKVAKEPTEIIPGEVARDPGENVPGKVAEKPVEELPCIVAKELGGKAKDALRKEPTGEMSDSMVNKPGEKTPDNASQEPAEGIQDQVMKGGGDKTQDEEPTKKINGEADKVPGEKIAANIAKEPEKIPPEGSHGVTKETLLHEALKAEKKIPGKVDEDPGESKNDRPGKTPGKETGINNAEIKNVSRETFTDEVKQQLENEIIDKVDKDSGNRLGRERKEKIKATSEPTTSHNTDSGLRKIVESYNEPDDNSKEKTGDQFRQDVKNSTSGLELSSPKITPDSSVFYSEGNVRSGASSPDKGIPSSPVEHMADSPSSAILKMITMRERQEDSDLSPQSSYVFLPKLSSSERTFIAGKMETLLKQCDQVSNASAIENTSKERFPALSPVSSSEAEIHSSASAERQDEIVKLPQMSSVEMSPPTCTSQSSLVSLPHIGKTSKRYYN